MSSSSSSDAFDLSARVASTTKDSIYVRWHVAAAAALHPPPRTRDLVQGFQVRYQAVGSTVVQYSHRLDASASAYDITQLHENTYYDICVKVFVKLNSTIIPAPAGSPGGGGVSLGPGGGGAQDVCVKGTTATDSLAVALGSTFGAFLALGFIVFLVFLAKWQHTRKMRKQKLVASGYDENGVEQLRGCDGGGGGGGDDQKETGFRGSGGIRFHDDLAMSELSGQSSEVSIALYADQMQDNNVDSDARGGGAAGGGEGGNVQPSSGPSSSLPRDHPEASDLVHQWITVTSNSPPDPEEGNWLLRPPPIPGVILRPQTRSTDAETEDKKHHQRASAAAASSAAGLSPSSSYSEDPPCSSSSILKDGTSRGKQPPATGNSGADEHSGVEQQHLFAHRPLKPTSSNLW